MDTATSDIRAMDFTPSRAGDSPVMPDLSDHLPQDEEIGTVAAHGACDTRRCHAAIIARQAAELHIRIALKIRLEARGTAGILRAA